MTTLDLARRFLGIKETAGGQSTPIVLAMLRLCDPSVLDDSVAWCAAYTHFVAWMLDLPRSKSLAARSWLTVGQPVELVDAKPGDVVILSRGPGPQPGPEVTTGAAGHVGFLDRYDGRLVWLLAGNQGDAINVAAYPVSRVLGVRRLV